MKNLFAFLLSMWILNPLAAQWEPMHGPYGGIILDLVKNDHYQFAATSNGLFRSADGGQTWNRSSVDTVITYGCNEIGINGNSVVARCFPIDNKESIHLFKSTDSGNTWEEISLPQGVTVDQIAVNDYGIYIKRFENIWVSTDQGNTWVPSNLPMGEPYTYPLFTYNGQVYTGANNVIYRSDNNADDWKTIIIDNMEDEFGSIHVFDSIMFVRSVVPDNLYRSQDYGETWTLASPVDWGSWNACFAKIGNAFIGSGTSSYYISHDLGVSWQAISSNNYIAPLNMITVGDTIIAGSFGPGMLVSTDASQTYFPSNNGLDAAYVSHISSDSEFVWAANAYGGVWRKSKMSDQWDYIHSLPGDLNAIDIKTQGQNVFVLDQNHQLYASPDYGNVWNNITPSGPFSTDFTEITIDGASVIVGGNVDHEYAAIRITQDTGRTWDAMSILIDDELIYPSLFARTSTAIYASESERKFRSLDNGVTWEELYNGPFFDSGCIHCGFEKLFSTEDILFLLEMDAYYNSTRLHTSPDNGDTWEVVDLGFPGTGFNAGFRTYATVGKTLLATDVNVENKGILASFDGGHSSISFHEGIPTQKISRVHADDQYLYASTAGFGVWRRKIDELLILSTRPTLAKKEIVLYPNPSNGSINLLIDSFTAGVATIVITDIQGKQVDRKEISFEGLDEINIHSLLPGLYFLTLKTSNELYTGKFIIAE